MNITRKRIINPQRYLYALHPGDKFYIAVPLEMEDYPRLQSYGLLPGVTSSYPNSSEGCNQNECQWQVEDPQGFTQRGTFFEHDYHIVDWHGTDHYGTCWQSRCVISEN